MTEAIEKLIAANRWQPIEEAPKDGEDVVLLIPGSVIPITIGHCLDGDWFPQDETTLDGNMLIPEPTHFRALPDDRLADVCQELLSIIIEVEKMLPHGEGTPAKLHIYNRLQRANEIANIGE